MARSIEQVLREQIGNLAFQNSVLISQLETLAERAGKLEAELEELKKASMGE